jgi:hypothetical protein
MTQLPEPWLEILGDRPRRIRPAIAGGAPARLPDRADVLEHVDERLEPGREDLIH